MFERTVDHNFYRIVEVLSSLNETVEIKKGILNEIPEEAGVFIKAKRRRAEFHEGTFVFLAGYA